MRFLISVAVVILFVAISFAQKDSDEWQPLYVGEVSQVLIRPDKIMRLDAEGWTKYIPVLGKRTDSLTCWIKQIPVPGKHKEWLEKMGLSDGAEKKREWHKKIGVNDTAKCEEFIDYVLQHWAIDYKRGRIRLLNQIPYDNSGNDWSVILIINTKTDWFDIVPGGGGDRLATAIKKVVEK